MADVRIMEVGTDWSEAALRECLAVFHQVRFRVTGACMEPKLSPGETVIVADALRRPPRIGDVVLMRQPAGLRLHRLIWGPPLAPRFLSWRTKADCADAWDPKCSHGDILGIVVAVEGKPQGDLGSSSLIALRSLTRALWTRFRRPIGGS
jgi:hypothetical protein